MKNAGIIQNYLRHYSENSFSWNFLALIGPQQIWPKVGKNEERQLWFPKKVHLRFGNVILKQFHGSWFSSEFQSFLHAMVLSWSWAACNPAPKIHKGIQLWFWKQNAVIDNKDSKSLSHIKFILILFFAQKMCGVVIVFSFLLLRPPRTSEALKKVQILDSWKKGNVSCI